MFIDYIVHLHSILMKDKFYLCLINLSSLSQYIYTVDTLNELYLNKVFFNSLEIKSSKIPTKVNS